MMLTEEQAREKWCPLSRPESASYAICGGNRDRDGRPSSKVLCMGSACMAWRWGMKVETGIKHPPGDENVTITWTPESETHGYCGAFGRPE